MKLQKLAIGVLAIALVMFNTGCFSAYKTYSHNRNIDQQMLQVRASGAGDAEVRVNLLALNKGYFAAWGDDPAGMTLATVGDVATGVLLWKGYEEISDSNNDNDEPTTEININGNNNNTSVNNGEYGNANSETENNASAEGSGVNTDASSSTAGQ